MIPFLAPLAWLGAFQASPALSPARVPGRCAAFARRGTRCSLSRCSADGAPARSLRWRSLPSGASQRRRARPEKVPRARRQSAFPVQRSRPGGLARDLRRRAVRWRAAHRRRPQRDSRDAAPRRFVSAGGRARNSPRFCRPRSQNMRATRTVRACDTRAGRHPARFLRRLVRCLSCDTRAGKDCGCGVRPAPDRRQGRPPASAPRQRRRCPGCSRSSESLDRGASATVRCRKPQQGRDLHPEGPFPLLGLRGKLKVRYHWEGNLPRQKFLRERDLIPRYTREEMGRVWSDANKFARWLEVEIAAADTLAEAGQIPKQAAAAIRQRSQINVARIDELEAKVKHDVIAFTMAVGESIGDPEAARWLHYGLTSNDVVDTAQALQVREASRLIEHGLVRFGAAAQQMAVGKISGAVGTCAHLGPEIEAKICRRLGLETAAVTSQVLQRDRHAQYLAALAVVAASLEKIALEIRHLQRTEVREAEEPFAGEQRGSSAMPHKRNPVSCEQICGLARVVRSNSLAGLENVALWHERDISHSSVERIILPDSTILVDFMLARMAEIVTGMLVFTARMRRNLVVTGGLVFS